MKFAQIWAFKSQQKSSYKNGGGHTIDKYIARHQIPLGASLSKREKMSRDLWVNSDISSLSSKMSFTKLGSDITPGKAFRWDNFLLGSKILKRGKCRREPLVILKPSTVPYKKKSFSNGLNLLLTVGKRNCKKKLV